MPVTTIKFNRNDGEEFVKVLRSRVNQYFKDRDIDKFANTAMKVKTTFMIALYFIPLALLCSGLIQNMWLITGMWLLMSFGMAGIGLSIMHDANHGAYSKSSKLNNRLGLLLNWVGGYGLNWKVQHNKLHHSYTNIDGFDEDIINKIMRFSPHQKWKKYHKFQIIYGPLAYGLATIYWFVAKDFEAFVKYKKADLYTKKELKKNILGEILFVKIMYLTATVILPMIMLDIAWWRTLLFFFMMHYIGGLVLTLVFQPAHVIEETDFFVPDGLGSVENNWAIHQLKTTSNFARKNKFLTWFIGGLNHQVEHHLFPNICHIHYPKLAPIIKETAEEYGIPYLEHKTFIGAIASHFKLIAKLGNNTFDLSKTSLHTSVFK